MNYSEVVQKGQINYYDLLSNLPVYYQIFLLITLFVTIGVFALYIKRKLTMLSTLGIVILITTTVSIFPPSSYYDELYDEWADHYAKPYIEELPERKADVLNVESLKDDDGDKIMINFVDKNGRESQIETDSSYPIERMKGGSPYLTYKKLEKDLGNGIKPGMYGITLHLPEAFVIKGK